MSGAVHGGDEEAVGEAQGGHLGGQEETVGESTGFRFVNVVRKICR